jgi:hypothetical protein
MMCAMAEGTRGAPPLLRALYRLSFTLSLELAVLAVALWLGLFDPANAHRWIEREGFGWESLRAGRISTLFTSVLLVEGPTQWIRIAVLVAWAVGFHEWKRGSARTALVYLVTNTLSCLLAALVQGLCAAWVDPVPRFAALRDVGASAGAFGCAGALAIGLSPSLRRSALLGLLAYVAVKPLLYPSLLSDLTHAISLALGIWLGPHLGRLGAARRARP